LLERLAGIVGLDPQKFYATVKSMCGCDGARDEHFAALLMVADKYQLNPTLNQLYLVPTKRGIQVVIPVDGWVPLLTAHPDYLAHDVVMIWEGEPYRSKAIAATCRIWTRSRRALDLGPFEHTELLSECYRDTGPWKSHQQRMLGHKAVIQATRRCFGIYVMDSDEAARIGEPARPLQTAEMAEARRIEAVENHIKTLRHLLDEAAGCRDNEERDVLCRWALGEQDATYDRVLHGGVSRITAVINGLKARLKTLEGGWPDALGTAIVWMQSPPDELPEDTAQEPEDGGRREVVDG
jgi:hypothetical protein